MNDTPHAGRTADLVALAQATDANGHVDLTAYQAQRLILLHQSVDGLDARGLVADLTASPAYASPEGQAQVGPLIDAITRRLPSPDATRLADALDKANVNESWFERGFEDYVEAPLQSAYSHVTQATSDGLAWTDKQISDNLAAAKQWADGVRHNPSNDYLEHAAGELAARGSGSAQEYYGAMKGATGHGLNMIGETVDLAKFAHRFGTDPNFRNLVIGAAAIYASDAYHDPSKPVNDISKAAIGAWNEWEAGLENATREGKEQEYLGQAKGAAAIEIIATFVPATKLTKLAKVAEAADIADDLAPAAGRVAGRVERHAAGELAEELIELARDARRVQGRSPLEQGGADLMFSGLAGMKRSQGELRELVDGLRKSGDLDGLLQSGALAPKELGYLARHDVTMFDGGVSFHQALTKSIGSRELSSLGSKEIGDIGEAMVAHDLARDGYRDLVPIQNNSGHGNDMAAFNPTTDRWEIFEIKASVKGIAREQSGNPEPLITSRLQLAVNERGHWAPKNMWEEQARSTAEKILDEHFDVATQRLNVDTKWARVNIERDPISGELKGTPQIEKWMTPAERTQERLRSAPDDHGALSPAMPGHSDYALHERIKSKVAEIDKQNGRGFDATSERMTASLLTLAKDNGLTRVDHVLLSEKTPKLPDAQNLIVVQGDLKDPAKLYAHMPTAEAAQRPVQDSFAQLEVVNQRLVQERAQEHLQEQQRNQEQHAAMRHV